MQRHIKHSVQRDFPQHTQRDCGDPVLLLFAFIARHLRASQCVCLSLSHLFFVLLLSLGQTHTYLCLIVLSPTCFLVCLLTRNNNKEETRKSQPTHHLTTTHNCFFRFWIVFCFGLLLKMNKVNETNLTFLSFFLSFSYIYLQI